MQDDSHLTNKDFLAEYGTVNPPSPIKKDSHQKLLQKDTPPRFSFQYDRNQQIHVKKKIERNQVDEFNPYQRKDPQYCYPKFLSWIGSCCIPCKIFIPCCFCSCCLCTSSPLFQQETKSLGLLQQWGHFQRILQPGLHVINPISQSIVEINQQTKLLQYNQIGISRDNVQFKLTVVLFYRIVDSVRLAYRLGSIDTAECIQEIATGTLRSVLGQNVLQTIIENRQLITHKFTDDINRILQYWGLYVEICSLKEIFLDEDVKKALQSLAQARRINEAQIINFKAEVECSKLIKEVSMIINNEASFQMRYLNAVSEIINNGQNNTIIIKTELQDKPEKEKPVDKRNQYI